MKIKEFITSLYSYEFIAKETEPLSSDEEINLIIQDSSERVSEVVKPKKVEKTSHDKRIVDIPAGIYLLKVNNGNTRTRCKICSKLTIKTPERRQWRQRKPP